MTRKFFVMSSISSSLKKFRYWPPSARGAFTALPSGRKSAFVHLKRGDLEGTRWEAALSVTNREGQRLCSFDREEFAELRKISDRLLSTGELWNRKCRRSLPRAPDLDYLSDR